MSSPAIGINLDIPEGNATDGAFAAKPFGADFLARLAPFASVRAMNWCSPNNSTQVKWTDRPTSPGREGVPWEAVAALAGVAGKDLWVNVPDQADDDYVTELAGLLKSDLPPGVTLRVEYSNELWNGGFKQSHRLAAAAPADAALTKADANGRAAELAAKQLKRVKALFLAAWGADPGRVKFVLCGQANNTYWLKTGLAWGAANGFVPNEIGIAPYVSLPKGSDVDGLTADALFAALELDLSGKVASGIAGHAALAMAHGVPLVAYEGGQSVAPFDPFTRVVRNAAVKTAAQDDPRMAGLQADLFAVWSGAGGGLYHHYSLCSPATNWGQWGLLKKVGDTSAVKWAGMMALAAGRAEVVQPPPPPPLLVIDFGAGTVSAGTTVIFRAAGTGLSAAAV